MLIIPTAQKRCWTGSRNALNNKKKGSNLMGDTTMTTIPCNILPFISNQTPEILRQLIWVGIRFTPIFF